MPNDFQNHLGFYLAHVRNAARPHRIDAGARNPGPAFLAVFGVVDPAARLVLLFVDLLLFALGQVAAVE